MFAREHIVECNSRVFVWIVFIRLNVFHILLKEDVGRTLVTWTGAQTVPYYFNTIDLPHPLRLLLRLLLLLPLSVQPGPDSKIINTFKYFRPRLNPFSYCKPSLFDLTFCSPFFSSLSATDLTSRARQSRLISPSLVSVSPCPLNSVETSSGASCSQCINFCNFIQIRNQSFLK